MYTGPEYIYQAQWIARAMGCSIADIERVGGAGVPVESEGRCFYVLSLEDVALAVREDALCAYVIQINDQQVDQKSLLALLHQYHFHAPDLSAFDRIGRGRINAWIKIAEGEPPLSGTAQEIEYLVPGSGQTMALEKLDSYSLELESIWRTEQPIREAIQEMSALTAMPGDALARAKWMVPGVAGQDVFGRPIPFSLLVDEVLHEPGLYIEMTSEGVFEARRYGYVYRMGGQLSVVSPLWLDDDEVRAYWMILEDKPRPVTMKIMGQCLADFGIVEGIRSDKIRSLIMEVNLGAHRCGLYRIAEGEQPKKGRDAQVEILVDMSRHVGQRREDGSVDFREVNFAPNVYAGQPVARYIGPGPGAPGRTVQGRIIPARTGDDRPLRAGANVRAEHAGGVCLFYATLNGTLKLFDDELAVVEVLTIQGDVSFHTGNLHFGGAIYINGSVVQGFSVEAGGDVTIAGTIEAGARVLAEKDVVVGKGIVGRKTKVRAKGDIRAQFVHEASVVALRDIELGNYAYHVHMRAGRHVIIRQASGQNGGSIMGGQVWAGQAIETYSAGTRNGTPTMLNVGLEPEHAQEVDRLNHHIETLSAHIERILERFGLDHIDVTHIRQMVQASVPPRRRILAQLARELGKLTQVYQKQLAKRQQLEEQLGTELKEAEIRIWNRAYSGVVIRLGDQVRELVEDVRAPHYRLRAGVLLEA